MSNDPNSVYERFIEIFKTFKYWVWGTFKFSEMTVNQAIDIEAPNHVIYDPQSTSFDRLPIVTFTLEEDSDDKTVYSVLIYDKTENSNFAREFAANAVLSKIDVIRQGGYYCHRYRKTYLNRKILDHSIDFFNLSEDPPVCKNSFKDFHLIPVIRPWNDRGPLSLMIAGIPDTERRVDITNFLQEGEKRGVPTGEWEFYIDHEKWKDWVTCYRALVHYFHGFKMVLRLKDYELDRLFIGRITVKNYTPGNDYSKIVLEYQLLREANIDPSKLGLCFQAWWLDWNGDPIDYIPIPWGSTPSTSSTDDGTSYGPDPSAAYDNQTFTPDLPVRIEIIQQPSILSYYDGATINYSGISVRAFNSAGDIWSANSRYLSGMIPYSELQFPIAKASFVSTSLMSSGYFQTLPVNWPRIDDRHILSSSFLVKIRTIIHHIEVTTPPNKIIYFDGDEIDYTGIVVTAYTRKVPGDSSSELIPWTNDGKYSNGIIPIEDLIFPIETAEYGESNEIRIPVKYIQHTTIDTEYSANFGITVNIKPYRIEVITSPTKLEYGNGEIVDYNGMIVKAYTEDGSIWTDSTHKDGIIPLQELTLYNDPLYIDDAIDISYEIISDDTITIDGYQISLPIKTIERSSDIINDGIGYDLRYYSYDIVSAGENAWSSYNDGTIGFNVNLDNDYKGKIYFILYRRYSDTSKTEYLDDYDLIAFSDNQFNGHLCSIQIDNNGNARYAYNMGSSSSFGKAGKYTYKGKSIYYARTPYTLSTFENKKVRLLIEESAGDYVYPHYTSLGEVAARKAWIALYGEEEYGFMKIEKGTIPINVKWNREDFEEALEDSFDVKVTVINDDHPE